MFEYRITKYNPIFRVNGIYTRDDWTSICDVGKKYNGCTLTTDECATVMSNYVNCIMEIIATAQVPEFTVSDVEVYNIKYKRKFRLKNGEVVCSRDSVISLWGVSKKKSGAIYLTRMLIFTLDMICMSMWDASWIILLLNTYVLSMDYLANHLHRLIRNPKIL